MNIVEITGSQNEVVITLTAVELLFFSSIMRNRLKDETLCGSDLFNTDKRGVYEKTVLCLISLK